ncbi:MAG: hypothetical protein V9F01_04900 [Chitinophagaceae bacterium]
MKLILTSCLFLIVINCAGQSIGINTLTPDASAQLDIVSNSKGFLVPRMTELERNAIATPATGLLIFQTDIQPGFYYNAGTPGTPVWTYNGPVTTNWNIAGNSLLATGRLGTNSNNHVDLATNNTVRGRLTNLGEFFIGATNTVVTGDLMGAVSNATFPFAVNGYSSFNGSGVYGTIQAGTTQFAAVQGEYANSASSFNTAGVRGSNQSVTAGTGFRTQAATGPRVGVIGNTTAGSGQYTFGLHGSMGSTDIRCGAVIGDDFGIALGALAYYAATLIDYSVYGFGGAYQVGVGGGRNSHRITEPNTQIGIGIYGGVMGGWVKGLVYGTHLQGERYSLYVDGKTYTNEPVTELVTMTDGSRMPAYAVSSLQPELYARGKSVLENGQRFVAFDPSFISMISEDPEALVITVSATGNSKGLYIASQDTKGFYVRENDNGTSATPFSWIAVASRKDYKQITHAPELLQGDFDKKMNGVMFNDNNRTDKPQSIWWDGSQVRFDTPPVKKADASYQPAVRTAGKKQE